MGAFKIIEGASLDKTFTTRLRPWEKRKPYNRPSGEGKTSQRRLRREGNAPLSPPVAVLLHGKASHVIFRSLSLPYKSRSLATPEGEVLAALSIEMLMRQLLICGLFCHRLRGKSREAGKGEPPEVANLRNAARNV